MDLSSSIEVSPLNGRAVVADLQWLIEQAGDRMMTDTLLWANEVVAFLPSKWVLDYEASPNPTTSKISSSISVSDRDVQLGRSLLSTRDFPRASIYFDRVRRRDGVTKFLYFWSRYLTLMRDQGEHNAESFDRKGSMPSGAAHKEDPEMEQLLQDMYVDVEENGESKDAFFKYLVAKVECATGLLPASLSSMTEAIRMEPRLWPAWQDIVPLLPTAQHIQAIASLESSTDSTWMGSWFSSLAMSRFNFDRDATERCEQLVRRGLVNMPMITSQMAACANHTLEHDRAIELFDLVRDIDPLRLENMHLFSDSLFCMGERVRLTSLTHLFFRTHKFQWETCCIVGNYYNMRGDHEQAIRFFQRALRLNPQLAGIWVLIGHEFLELKNNSAACMSYRKAIEIDPNDYRGWYGIGQMYDILKMPTYALYYYQEAHKCRPQDSRMLVALGAIYSKMGRIRDAQKCFTSAFKYGDVEGNALWHLAKLFEGESLHDQAAQTYEAYINSYDDGKAADDNLSYVLSFLAKFFLEKGDWDKATSYAQRCLEHETISEEGRSILQQVSQQKSKVLSQSPLAGPSTPSRNNESADTEKTQSPKEANDSMELAGSEDDESFGFE